MLRFVRRPTIITHNNHITTCQRISTQIQPSRVSTSAPSWKEPTRGGQNLAKRYERLERSLRGKEAYGKEIKELAEEAATLQTSGSIRRRNVANTFMGFAVPVEPQPPGPEECCMSGCAICVQDLYIEALGEYRKAVESLRTSLALLKVPEDQWPPNIRTKSNAPEPPKSVSLSAFEELERRLSERHTKDPHPMAALLSPRHIRKPKSVLPDMRSVYEGMRWVLFSTR